jgi:hypothetical protein
MPYLPMVKPSLPKAAIGAVRMMIPTTLTFLSRLPRYNRYRTWYERLVTSRVASCLGSDNRGDKP